PAYTHLHPYFLAQAYSHLRVTLYFLTSAYTRLTRIFLPLWFTPNASLAFSYPAYTHLTPYFFTQRTPTSLVFSYPSVHPLNSIFLFPLPSVTHPPRSKPFNAIKLNISTSNSDLI
uniref:Ovule protein n=1 Tax=Macrostomum lignano TaxID=282301 RepID=A0A1I8FNQ1_9PLAT